MPILNGLDAVKLIRVMELNSPQRGAKVIPPSAALNGRIPVFAVSASLPERQRAELINYGMDGWMVKPVNFKRMRILINGIINTEERSREVYRSGCSWEAGGWFDRMADS